MAAPTNVRVEAVALTETFIRWTVGSPTASQLYRSTDGASYSQIAVLAAGTVIYNDTGLASGTKYWYKLSADNGSTFSSVVTVWTHSCETDLKGQSGFALPRHKSNQGDLIRKVNKTNRDIEDLIGKKLFPQDPCIACIVDGALVIDCKDECDCYEVEVSENINSISFIGCESVDPCIRFKVPPNVTRGICGWPQGKDSGNYQYSGDECTSAPISGGTGGRTVTTGKKPPSSKPGSGVGSRGGKSGTTCECLPSKTGGLTVKCCTADCSMGCSGAKSLNVKICGGTAPYTITGSAGLVFKKVNGTTVTAGSTALSANETIVVTPPANSGSGVAGTAYVKFFYGCSGCAGGICTAVDSQGHIDYSCNDVASACFASSAGHSHCTPSVPAASEMNCDRSGASCVGVLPPCPVGQTCQSSVFRVCDDRTAPMIAGGCNPCGVSTSGKTITVTDAQGVSVIKTLAA